MNKFIDYCMPKKNLVYERFVFNTCNQNQGQTIDSYVTELSTKFQSCEYYELKDSLIRDPIVVGTNSTKLQEKMLQYKNLTLQSAISLCKSAETTTRQMKVLHEEAGALHEHGGTEPVNVIKRDRKKKPQKKRNVAFPGEKSNCEICGIKHIPKRCQAYNNNKHILLLRQYPVLLEHVQCALYSDIYIYSFKYYVLNDRFNLIQCSNELLT